MRTSNSADAGTPGLRIVPGIEFSSQWSGHTIHVVGLGIDLDSQILEDCGTSAKISPRSNVRWHD